MLAKTHYLVTANTQGYSFYNYLGKVTASNITHSLEGHDNSVEAAFLSRIVTHDIHALAKLLGLRSGYRAVSSKIENIIYEPERRILEEAFINEEDLVDICYHTQTASHRVRAEGRFSWYYRWPLSAC